MRAAVAVAALGAALVGCAHARSAPPPDAAKPTKPPYEHAAETGIPFSSTPQGLMRNGAEHKIQEGLRARRLLTEAECTGVLDATTFEAIRRFQKAEGLPTTGLPSYETVRHLGLDLDVVFHTARHPREPASAAMSAPAVARP